MVKEPEMTVMNGRWGLCFDEKIIALDGGTQGYKCALPFLMNEKYYEQCTREITTLGDRHHTYWCPSQEFLEDDTNEWQGNITLTDTYGYCNEAYQPQGDCPDHYDPVNEYSDCLFQYVH